MLVPVIVLIWLGISIIYFFLHPQNVPLLTVVYSSFLKALFSIQFRLPESFFVDLGCEVISLALHGIVGVLFLRLCIRLPIIIEWAAGIFVGIGLSTFILELWAIPFLLNRWTVLLTLAALAALFYLCRKRWDWARQDDIEIPASAGEQEGRAWFWIPFTILAGLTALSFYHALLFPVDYWDALILYINYGKMTYQQGGFPILYCLQVGLGLGANYPHLYPLHQAATGMIFGHWSDLYGQLLPPLAGLGSIIVLYHLSLRLFQNRIVAIISVLVFRSIPFVSTYFIWASDYSLVMFYTCLFLLFAEIFLSKPAIRTLFPLMAVSAMFPHINYLGWIVWPVLALAILWRFKDLLNSKNTWLPLCGWFLFWFGLALTWYVRNWWVTGNPVYAFFPEIFGGKNINLEVLASCQKEWTAHGMGAAQFGETLLQKVVNSLFYFMSDWRFAPLLTGIMLPGFVLGWKRKQPFFVIAGSLFAFYFVYQYIISGLYWYHTIAVCPILALYAGRFLNQVRNQKTYKAFCVLILFASMVPGFSVAVMGPKIPDPGLPLFAHPGLSPQEYYRFAYPNEAPVWRYINKNLEPDAMILSHDNRYLVYRDDIQIIHLDDCGLTPFYGKPYPDVHKELLRRGVRYYLFIPDELSHPITARLGHAAFLNNPDYFKPVFASGNTPVSVRLYRLVNKSPLPQEEK